MKVLDCSSNLYRNNTPCPQFLYYKEIKRPRKLPRLSECEKVFWKTCFIFKRKKKDQVQGKGKKSSRRAPVDPKGNYQHEWRLG